MKLVKCDCCGKTQPLHKVEVKGVGPCSDALGTSLPGYTVTLDFCNEECFERYFFSTDLATGAIKPTPTRNPLHPETSE